MLSVVVKPPTSRHPAMAGGEKTASVWCLAKPQQKQVQAISEKDEKDHMADTFLTKVKRYFISSRGSCMEKGARKKATKPSYQFSCCFIFFLLIFISSSVGCILMWFTEIYLDSILNQMTLKNGTEIFEAWKNPPLKPLICVHIFNYTNLDEYFNNETSKIAVSDTGPYCYRETLEKTDIQFYDDGTVSYGDRRTHVFEERYSSGSMDDLLVVPNLPLIFATVKIRELNSKLYDLILLPAVKRLSGDMMITVRAHNFTFGYNDKIITLAKMIYKEIPFKNFGVLAMRAAETKDRITVWTGSEDLNNIGVVTAVNGEEILSAWDNDECNRIDGSDGAFFPRHEINESARLFLFHKDLCRKLPLVYEKEVDFQDGVMGMRFHTPPDVYNTTGTCYCKGGKCPPPGVFDVSPCANGIPLMMSFPHFMNAHHNVTDPFEGLHPDPKKHDFYIDIQPVLGFTLGTVSRIQINIHIKGKMFPEFPNDIILPVAWFEVTTDRLPPDFFKMIYHASVTVPYVKWSLQWGFLIFTIFSGYFLFKYRPRHKQSVTHVSPASEKKSREIIISKITSI